MELIFTKGAEKYDQLRLIRRDQADELIDCPKQRIIPHDMVHYAVETVLDARGFLGRIADGDAASFQMAPSDEGEGVERLVEVIQGDAWSGASPPDDLIDLYRITCEARASNALAVDVATIDAIRALMADLGKQWDAVPVGGSMSLMFNHG